MARNGTKHTEAKIFGDAPPGHGDLLLCDVCSRDVGAAYVVDQHNGWVVWWADPKTSPNIVRAIHVCCHGPMAREDDVMGDSWYCLKKLTRRFHNELGYQQLDHHMRDFAGPARAMGRLWSLRGDYNWAKRADERLIELFLRIQKLPAWDGSYKKEKPRTAGALSSELKRIAEAMGGADRVLDELDTLYHFGEEGPDRPGGPGPSEGTF